LPTGTGCPFALALLHFFGFSRFGRALGTAKHYPRIVARLAEVVPYPFADHKTNFTLAPQLGKVPCPFGTTFEIP